MNTTINKIQNKLQIEEIKRLYTSGIKPKSLLKTGLEYERLPVSASTSLAASYYTESGVCEILREFAREENWDYITDDINIIGLKQFHNTVTLEPGSQLEFSTEPQRTVAELKNSIEKIDKFLKPIFDKKGIRLLNYGVSPLSTYKSIRLIPKRRYHIMAEYLWGILSDVMMRETAGIQGTFDFISEEDAMKKFKIANKLTPFMTALFANSPIRGGVDTGYKSFRALSWLNTDNERCGYCYNFDNEFSFDEYINYVMSRPMLFITRNNNTIEINGKIDFNKFMQTGYLNAEATMDDYLLQANLCFPEVRLRNFIEIRNQDCNSPERMYAIIALYKGILYDDNAIEEINNLFKDYKFKDFAELRYIVPRLATESPFGKHKVKDFIKEIYKISHKSLVNNFKDEEIFLESISELVEQGISPADIILKNWYGSWNKNIKKLIDFVS